MSEDGTDERKELTLHKQLLGVYSSEKIESLRESEKKKKVKRVSH